MTLFPTGQMSPGAVPFVWGITLAPSGTSACRSLLAGIVQPGLREAKSALIACSTASSRRSGTFMTTAIASRVRSS